MASIVVCGSGTVISSLLFSLKNVGGDAEGFLLGEVLSRHVNTISDSVSEGSREEREICLHSFVSVSKKCSFYNRSAIPDIAKLQMLLGDRQKEVVGWFSYRPNSSHRISMREKALHARLAACFSHLDNKDFVLALVTDRLPDGTTICTTEYSFLCCDGRFITVNSNLSTLPASTPYQTTPTYPHSHPGYISTLQQHRSKFMEDGDIQHSNAVRALCTDLLSQLEPLGEELLTSGRELKRVRREVEVLRAEVEDARKVASSSSSSLDRGCDISDSSHQNENRHAQIAVLIDLETMNETQPPDLAPSSGISPQQPDLLGDFVIIPDSPGEERENQAKLSEPLAPLQDTATHPSLSQELF